MDHLEEVEELAVNVADHVLGGRHFYNVGLLDQEGDDAAC